MFDQFDTNVILENLHFLIAGMQLTLLLTVAAICGGLVLGTFLHSQDYPVFGFYHSFLPHT